MSIKSCKLNTQFGAKNHRHLYCFNSDLYKINFVTNLPNCGQYMYMLFFVKGKQKKITMLHIHERHKSLWIYTFSFWMINPFSECLKHCELSLNHKYKNYNKNYNMRHTFSEIQLDVLPHVRILSFQIFQYESTLGAQNLCGWDYSKK